MKINSPDYKSVDTVALMEKENQLRKPANLCLSVGVICIAGGVSLLDVFGMEDFRVFAIIGALIALAIAGYQYFQIWQIKKELASRSVAQAEVDTAKANNKKANMKYILILLVLALLCFFFSTLDYGKKGDSNSATNECKSCHRTFEAGDRGGNYKNIARSGMCNNCQDNYESLNDALGK